MPVVVVVIVVAVVVVAAVMFLVSSKYFLGISLSVLYTLSSSDTSNPCLKQQSHCVCIATIVPSAYAVSQ